MPRGPRWLPHDGCGGARGGPGGAVCCGASAALGGGDGGSGGPGGGGPSTPVHCTTCGSAAAAVDDQPDMRRLPPATASLYDGRGAPEGVACSAPRRPPKHSASQEPVAAGTEAAEPGTPYGWARVPGARPPLEPLGDALTPSLPLLPPAVRCGPPPPRRRGSATRSESRHTPYSRSGRPGCSCLPPESRRRAPSGTRARRPRRIMASEASPARSTCSRTVAPASNRTTTCTSSPTCSPRHEPGWVHFLAGHLVPPGSATRRRVHPIGPPSSPRRAASSNPYSLTSQPASRSASTARPRVSGTTSRHAPCSSETT